jgi:hypothetical protein
MKNSKLRTWGNFDKEFVDELASWVGERKVLEVFAGNGVLANELAKRGVDIVATSKHSHSFDGDRKDFAFDVKECEARDAVIQYGDDRDILLMSWPTTIDEGASGAALLWGQDRLIVFIGEVTDLPKGFYGGCATDLFFDMTEETASFTNYKTDGVDKAIVRRTVSHARDLWLKAHEQFQAQRAFGFGRMSGSD